MAYKMDRKPLWYVFLNIDVLAWGVEAAIMGYSIGDVIGVRCIFIIFANFDVSNLVLWISLKGASRCESRRSLRG